jgi:hypothetical protein
MRILDRYAGAVHSGNLSSKPDTTFSDTDVLGAAGKASKMHPLALALARLYCGDNHAVSAIVVILAETVWGKSATMPLSKPLRRTEAEDMARSVLAWHREGTCRVCGGHGFKIAGGMGLGNGRAVIGSAECDSCKGGGRIPFERQFPTHRIDIARWLLAEVEREQCVAGPEAMKMLADRMTL